MWETAAATGINTITIHSVQSVTQITHHGEVPESVCVILGIIGEISVGLVRASPRGPDLPLLLQGEAQHGGLVGRGQVELLLQSFTIYHLDHRGLTAFNV